jgi:hypothetical protein
MLGFSGRSPSADAGDEGVGGEIDAAVQEIRRRVGAA